MGDVLYSKCLPYIHQHQLDIDVLAFHCNTSRSTIRRRTLHDTTHSTSSGRMSALLVVTRLCNPSCSESCVPHCPLRP